ncbi:MAG: hypothetical protein IJ790_03640 [Lachnospiraceae bacterium]|nr:hypothetical protein [Lachnospiraceae bacterium]
MKKFLLMLLLPLVLCVSCVSNQSTEALTSAQETEAVVNDSDDSTEGEEAQDSEKASGVIESVNKMNETNANVNTDIDFKYVGEDKYLPAITENMLKDAKQMYDTDGIIQIPTPYIVETDDSDKSDIKVYGDFWTFGYKLEGTIFYMDNGGSMPGCYHLALDDNGNVTFLSREIAEDGSRYEPSLLAICGGNRELYNKITNRDDIVLDTLRLYYANMYANTNGIKFSGIKDYGWPVILLDDISDADFLYNFYYAYFGELLDDNILKDRVNRIKNLTKKYIIESVREKIDKETKDSGVDYVIGTNDATKEMADTLQVDDYGNGNLKVRFVSDKKKIMEIDVKVEKHDGKKVITDINY